MAQALDLEPGPQAEAAPPGAIGLGEDLFGIDQDAAGRQVRPLDEAGKVGGCRRSGIGRAADQPGKGRQDLARVVRRDAGRHPDGDAGGTVGQEVRECGRQDAGLRLAAVVGWSEIDRVLVDPFQERHGDGGEPCLGVAHGRRIIAVDIAEIALAVDQRVTLRETLRQANQGVVNRHIAVRVELADDVAHDPGALLEAARRIEPQLAHGVEEAALHGLEAVAHVGQ